MTTASASRNQADGISAGNEPGLGTLFRMRTRELGNRLRILTRESPLRLAATFAFVVLIWLCLYLFFFEILDQMQQRMRIESVVAIPLIFHFFFVALTIMLIFSNGVLVHGALFGRGEAAYLYTLPVAPRTIVKLKFIESLVFSSWSLILLGFPLMMALSGVMEEPAQFYVLFVGLFLAFVPIPGAIGLIGACAAGLWFPRSARRLLIGLGMLAGGGAFVWVTLSWRGMDATSADWLDNFLSRMDLVRSALLPSTWVTRGVDSAVRGQPAVAAFYLWVTACNAAFWCWLAVRFVAPRTLTAFARVQSSTWEAPGPTGSGGLRRWTRTAGRWLGPVTFFFLSERKRAIVLKDVRCFLRDPMQWSQLGILLGLMALYIINIPRVNPAFEQWKTQRLISFLNLAAVSLILATFTSRFVFPLVSLEGQQLWLIGLLPISRIGVVWAKFAFALAITLASAMVVMGLAIWMLHPPWPLALVQVVGTAATCVGLCGLSVGMGAMLPVFHQRNPTRIANGFGGTINLLLSVGFVVFQLSATCWLILFRPVKNGLSGSAPMPADRSADLDAIAAAVLIGVFLFSVVVAAVSMRFGARKFARMEV